MTDDLRLFLLLESLSYVGRLTVFIVMNKSKAGQRQKYFVCSSLTCREQNYSKGLVWNALFTYVFDSSSDKPGH